MDRKKILFFSENLKYGGIEKNLVSILKTIDYDKYRVDLLLLENEGELIKELPKQVHILDPLFPYFGNTKKLLLSLNIRLIKIKILMFIKVRICKNLKERENFLFTLLENNLCFPLQKYDISIGFHDGICNYLNIRKIQAAKKVTWLNNDYSYWCNTDTLTPVMESSDFIVSVSKSQLDTILQLYPQYGNKCTIINNFINSDRIKTLANETAYTDNYTGVRILTVGRISPEKGQMIAIEACRILAEEGIDFKWYFAGDGNYKNILSKLVKKFNLSKNIVFLGNQSNPYSFMTGADIYIQPSLSESYGIAVAEAKFIGKPIVASKIPSLADILGNYKNCLLFEVGNAAALASAITKMITLKLTDAPEGDTNDKEVIYRINSLLSELCK